MHVLTHLGIGWCPAQVGILYVFNVSTGIFVALLSECACVCMGREGGYETFVLLFESVGSLYQMESCNNLIAQLLE